MAINLNGANKAAVLAALYNASQPMGMGWLNATAAPMTQDEAEKLLKEQTYFDYLRGRVMKVDLSGDSLEERLYDRDNGHGAAYDAIRHLLKDAALSRTTGEDVLSPEGGHEAVAECHCIARAAISTVTGEQS